MPPKKKRGLPPGALHHVERKYFKVLFCGEEFPAGAEETRKALEKHDAVGNCEFRFVACAREQVATEIVDADVAVPLMTKIDETLLAKAPILKLVLQFGVGLEGVDEEACTKRGILLARIPSEKTGNADSTAEMAVFLLLAGRVLVAHKSHTSRLCFGRLWHQRLRAAESQRREQRCRPYDDWGQTIRLFRPLPVALEGEPPRE